MKVFSIFEDLGISVVVSTSEVSISLTLEQGYRMVFQCCGRTVGIKGWPHPLLPTPY